MTGSKNVEVKTYDGHKGGEAPRKVIISGKEYPVKQVLETSRVRRVDGEGDEEHFRVSLAHFGEAKIVYHHSWDGWSLEGKRGGKPLTDIFFDREEK